MTPAEQYANEYTGYEINDAWTIVQHGFTAGFDYGKEERTKLVTHLDICRGSLNDAVRQLEEKDKELEAANDLIAVMNKELFYYQNSR